MKALYFDCSSGISGNMVLGALLELCDDQQILENELKKLHLEGYELVISKQKRNGLTGTYIEVKTSEQKVHRHLSDINKIIDESDLDGKVKDLAENIFLRVAKAESKVHGVDIEEIHFHEVGALDSIIDIVGCAILISYLNPDKIYSSVVNDGYGFIECAHGTISVPVPATVEIFAQRKARTRQIDINTELVTPTGAAIISELAHSFGSQPTMTIQKIGWGCGSKDLRIPNLLKVIEGEIEDYNDSVTIMETNIDDCSSEILSYTATQLFDHHALDVFFTPIYMKKNRPAYRLTVACKKEDVETLRDIIFKETTTIGIRYRQEKRFTLEREIIEKETEYGKIHFKRVYHQDEIYDYPEFEDLMKVAKQTNLPLKEIDSKVRSCHG